MWIVGALAIMLLLLFFIAHTAIHTMSADLPGGDARVLFSSLKKLADRRDNPMIHPGHGASCALADADVIRAIRQQNF